MRSNLPNRRLLGNWNLPNRRLLGDWRTDVARLDASEIAGFLARRPDAQKIVIQFENLVARFGYSQGASGYPIPEWGMSVADTELGNVVIFPDAFGVLRYTASAPAGIAAQINLPPYVSPPGDDGIPWKALLWIAGGLLAVSVVNTVRGR